MQPLDEGDPDRIGPYRLLGRLGAGGMGRVYLARSAGGRTVAVKVVHAQYAADEEFRARFRREIDAARRVGTGPGGHRWSVPVLDADPEAAVPWVATGYVAGPSLTQAVQRHGPLPGSSVRAMGAGLAEALAAVHDLRLVHRDVKPSNVLLSLDGPRLIDFGIARATDGTASLTSTGVSVGSPGYMAPEQILGRPVTGAADVFSLGAVLAYAATGVSPFPGDSSAALLYKVVHGEPELGAMAAGLRELAARCLAKDPAARPAPGEIARQLASDGAAGQMAAGWLPAPLVEEVSRAAVRLLDLETAAPGPSASGPLPAPPSAAPYGADGEGTGGGDGAGIEGAGTGGGPGAGTSGFGPWVRPAEGAMPGAVPDSVRDAVPDAVPGPGTSAPREAGGNLMSVPGVSDPRVSDPRVPDPEVSDSRFTVSFTAEGGDAGDDGRRVGGPGPRRSVSCTLAMAVAGALAAATVGGLFLAGLLTDGGRPSTDSAARPGASTSPPPYTSPARSVSPDPGTSPDPGASPRPGPVPAGLVGTWNGSVSAAGLPAGAMKVTIRKGSTGDQVGTAEQTDILGNFICEDLLTLTGVQGSAIIVDTRRGPRSTDMCTGSSTGLRLQLKGDGLQYISQDTRAGNPTGTLARQ